MWGAAPAPKAAQCPPHRLCLPAPAGQAFGVDPFSSASLGDMLRRSPKTPSERNFSLNEDCCGKSLFIAIIMDRAVHTACSVLESQGPHSVHTLRNIKYNHVFCFIWPWFPEVGAWNYAHNNCSDFLTVFNANQLLLNTRIGCKCEEFLKISCSGA